MGWLSKQSQSKRKHCFCCLLGPLVESGTKLPISLPIWFRSWLCVLVVYTAAWSLNNFCCCIWPSLPSWSSEVSVLVVLFSLQYHVSLNRRYGSEIVCVKCFTFRSVVTTSKRQICKSRFYIAPLALLRAEPLKKPNCSKSMVTKLTNALLTPLISLGNYISRLHFIGRLKLLCLYVSCWIMLCSHSNLTFQGHYSSR